MEIEVEIEVEMGCTGLSRPGRPGRPGRKGLLRSVLVSAVFSGLLMCMNSRNAGVSLEDAEI